jgi:hypothetical protein
MINEGFMTQNQLSFDDLNKKKRTKDDILKAVERLLVFYKQGDLGGEKILN